MVYDEHSSFGAVKKCWLLIWVSMLYCRCYADFVSASLSHQKIMCDLNNRAYCILRKMRKMRKLHIGCINAQYLRKICARFSPRGQYMCKIVLLSPMRNICARFAQDCTYFLNAQYMRKIVLISPMCNICARYAQDCTYSSMCNICARLYLFLQCAIFVQDCTFFPNAQYMRKIVVISPVRNICARFAQDCSYFSNAQYMRKILLLSPMRNICARL